MGADCVAVVAMSMLQCPMFEDFDTADLWTYTDRWVKSESSGRTLYYDRQQLTSRSTRHDRFFLNNIKNQVLVDMETGVISVRP